jgi:hypothetical protein
MIISGGFSANLGEKNEGVERLTEEWQGSNLASSPSTLWKPGRNSLRVATSGGAGSHFFSIEKAGLAKSNAKANDARRVMKNMASFQLRSWSRNTLSLMVSSIDLKTWRFQVLIDNPSNWTDSGCPTIWSDHTLTCAHSKT